MTDPQEYTTFSAFLFFSTCDTRVYRLLTLSYLGEGVQENIPGVRVGTPEMGILKCRRFMGWRIV